MNKKSQIATVLLVVIAMVLALSALYVMVTFKDNSGSQSKDLSQLTFEVQLNSAYVKEQLKLIFNESLRVCQLCSAQQLKEEIIKNSNIRESINRYENSGNLYAKLRNGHFKTEKNGNTFTFSISDLFVQSERGYNKIQRNFNVTIESLS